MHSVTFAFDIGHSSIGWAALQEPATSDSLPSILGCGTVIFRPDDCQSQQRAVFRRQRRHAAATRNRIKRLGILLKHVGVLAQDDPAVSARQGGGHSFPWLLAAKVLTTDKKLTWVELWHVLRWYAHNRGYDGNTLWADDTAKSNEIEKSDTEKVQNAIDLMDAQQTATMAETICAFLSLDPKASTHEAPKKYFKGNNAAFPRRIVVKEVRAILNAHKNHLPKLTDQIITAIVDDWTSIEAGTPIRLPQRYSGGLLFGQMVPRFDNRIIPLCRISGEKTPSRHCRAFYRYRWGMLLANLRKLDPIGSLPIPLNADERRKLHAVMEKNGYLTKTSLGEALRGFGAEPANLDQFFLVPEMEKALVFDPVKRELATDRLRHVWPHIPPRFQSVFAGELFKGRKPGGKKPSIRQWRDRMIEGGFDITTLDEILSDQVEAAKKRYKGKKSPPDLDAILDAEISLQHRVSGRSPYSRKLMDEAWASIMSAEDPKGRLADGSYGPLAETAEIVARQRDIPADRQTNNHMVRHRLMIFERLLAQMTQRYAGGNAQKISTISIEVIRDLLEFSAITAKEKAQLLGIKLSDHRRTVAWLEEQREETGLDFRLTAGLIKKVRIARDLDWKCPFTGKTYSLQHILEGRVDREHVIPRSLRPSDSLESLVLTFTEINKWKGQRTAMRFIEETVDDPRTLTPTQFETLVNALPTRGGAEDDQKRRKKRKQFLLVRDYNKRDADFTGRDLTQTSHLNKLAARRALAFAASISSDPQCPAIQPHQIIHLPGSVTGAIRRAWRVNGCLAQANPRILDESGSPRPKGEIRDITHLHHALDASLLALATWYFPKDGRLWDLMSRRRLNDRERNELCSLTRIPLAFNRAGQFDLPDLPPSIKQQLSAQLCEKLVVMHLPRTMRGLKVQQNTWRILGVDPREPAKLLITQATRNPEGVRNRNHKSQKPGRLVGVASPNGNGKLAQLKGGLVVEENYGVALDPLPQVIPFIRVHDRIAEITSANKGASPRILRNGQIIQLQTGNYAKLSRRWRVRSIKDCRGGIVLDLTFPDHVAVENKGLGTKRNVSLKTLLAAGLTIESGDLTGSGSRSPS